jgi:hypothetical protein
MAHIYSQAIVLQKFVLEKKVSNYTILVSHVLFVKLMVVKSCETKSGQRDHREGPCKIVVRFFQYLFQPTPLRYYAD